jgi:diaminopimelate epimerase
VLLNVLKAHGCSNDVFLIDRAPETLGLSDVDLQKFVVELCSRRGSLGADGAYFIDDSPTIPRALYFNSDGSRSEYCGNGLRCVGRWLLEQRKVSTILVQSGSSADDTFEVSWAEETSDVRRVKVQSARPVRYMKFGASMSTIQNEKLPYSDELRFTAFNGPNPHLVAVVESFDETLLETIGVFANADRTRFLNGINTTFVLPIDKASNEFYVRTYERGAGFTESCASGASAAVALLVHEKIVEPSKQVTIINNGGRIDVLIEGDEDNLYPTQSGNASYVYKAEVDVESLVSGQHPKVTNMEAFADEMMAFDRILTADLDRLAECAGVLVR